jgi:hypothetical protein
MMQGACPWTSPVNLGMSECMRHVGVRMYLQSLDKGVHHLQHQAECNLKQRIAWGRAATLCV